MNIAVASSTESLSPSRRDFIAAQVSSALARFRPRITRISVQIVDETGARGGVEKSCRIHVWMPRFGIVRATARGENLMLAVNEAARRARRLVVSRLRRPHSVRRREHSRTNQDFEVATVA